MFNISFFFKCYHQIIVKVLTIIIKELNKNSIMKKILGLTLLSACGQTYTYHKANEDTGTNTFCDYEQWDKKDSLFVDPETHEYSIQSMMSNNKIDSLCKQLYIPSFERWDIQFNDPLQSSLLTYGFVENQCGAEPYKTFCVGMDNTTDSSGLNIEYNLDIYTNNTVNTTLEGSVTCRDNTNHFFECDHHLE